MDEPSMLAQKPSSSHLQSTSHILKSTFQNLFAVEKVDAETIRNLSASRRGNNDYHDKYVERLLVTHKKWSDCMTRCHQLVQYLNKAQEDARILEQKEEEEKMREFDSYTSLGLPPVTSKLNVFIDNTLLKNHSLINPSEILCQAQKLQFSDSAEKLVPQYESSTYQSRQLFERIPPIDCYKPRSPLLLPKGSHISVPPVMVRKDPGRQSLNGVARSEDKDVWRNCICPLQRDIEKKDLANLQKKANFLKNPRLVEIPKSFLNKTVNSKSDVHTNMDYFKPTPCPVVFKEYEVNLHYQIKLELRNVTSSCRQVRILQPSSKHFTVSQGEFPLDDSLVAPGMSCSYIVNFFPDNLGDFDDVLIVKTQLRKPMEIPLQARRFPPHLTLPKILSCGFCLVGDSSTAEYMIQNLGGAGRFCFQESNSQCPQWNAGFIKGGCIRFSAFTLTPSSFSLGHGETVKLQVTFKPNAVQGFNSKIKMYCDNCTEEEYMVEGCGEMAQVELSYVQDGTLHPKIGEICDVDAKKIISFGKQYPGVISKRQIHIGNSVSVPLQYKWGVFLPSVSTCTENIEVEDSVFSVEPGCGYLGGSTVETFDILFSPQGLGSFYYVLFLKLTNIPVRHPDDTYIKEDQIALKLSLKGTTQEFDISVNPASMVMAGEYFIGRCYYKTLSLCNLSSAHTTFKWKNIDDDECTLQIDPCEGIVEAFSETECLLTIQGKSVCDLQRMVKCEIPFSMQDHVLHFACSFTGPTVTFSEIRLSFGLVGFGECANNVVTIVNESPVPACWAIGELTNGNQDGTIFTFSPMEGLIGANSSQEIVVNFFPRDCRTYSTSLKCEITHGETCYLPVHAEVLRPNVRLKQCEILVEEAFLDISIEETVTLMNLNLLEAEFHWDFEYNDIFSISCDPKEGTLQPGQTKDVIMKFSFHQLGKLEQFVICKVKEAEQPLVLCIKANVNGLNVELTMPNMEDVRHQKDVIRNNDFLDFGVSNSLGEPVDAIVIIKNNSAIESSFRFSAKEFVPFSSQAEPDGDKKMRKGLYSLLNRTFSATKTRSAVEQERNNCKDIVLQNGKGLAFVCSPAEGKLLPFETKMVTVTAYTDMWGEYYDTLICQIGTIHEEHIQMHIDVVGCPLNFQICKEQAVMVRFGAHVSGDKALARSLRINNTSYCDIRLDWQTFIVDQDDDYLIDLNVYIGDPFPVLDENGEESISVNDSIGNGKLISVHMEEHCGKRSKIPFSIPTTQVIIPGKQSGSIDVNFHPPVGVLEETKYLGYALGYMSLDEKDRFQSSLFSRAHGIDMMPFSLNTTADVKPARVHVEACDEDGFHYDVSASDLLREGMVEQQVHCDRRFIMTNRSGTTVSFSLEVEPPFEIIHIGNNHKLGVTKKISMKSQENIEVRIRLVIDLASAAVIYQNSHHLIHNELVITFDNGKIQSYSLTGTVNYPAMEVSRTCVDLGVCFVGSSKESVLRISNPSKEVLSWSIEADIKCPETSRSVFSFSNYNGVLDGTALGSVESDVKVYFTPRHNVDYECVILVSSIFGKLCLNEDPVRVVLRGTGSYDEHAKAHRDLQD